MEKLNISRLSKLLLVAAIAILIISALANFRDYQDSWVLEGIEVPFALFVIVYVTAFFLEKKTSWMIVLAIIARIVFLIIPNLKYSWLQGTALDQQLQYALSNNVLRTGHISTESAYGAAAYTSTPLTHLSFSVFSIVLNIPVVDAMKYLPVLWSPLVPLLTFVIVDKMEFARKTPVVKCALFFSSIPFTTEQYLVTGSLLGSVLALLILSSLVLILRKNDRRYWLVCTIFVIALAAAHAVTTVILSASMLAILMLQGVPYFQLKSRFRATAILAIVSINVAWIMYQASYALNVIAHLVFFGVPSGVTPESERIPSTFFEELRVSPLSAIKSFSVLYGADAFLLILTLVSLIILLKTQKGPNDILRFTCLLGWLFLSLIVVGALVGVGGPRVLFFAELLFPIFGGILVSWISGSLRARKWIRSAITTLIILSVILLATIELYSCQPLVPPANIVYPGLPSNVPIGYVGQVNSIYQRQAVFFAENHVKGLIASDSTTSDQIIGLTGLNWSAEHLVEYYPIDKSQPGQMYDYFLIHLPGKSGILSELAPVRVPSQMLDTIYNSSIVYTNGESYMLSASPLR